MDSGDYTDVFPEMTQFIGGYFHQDWDIVYIWGDETPSYQAVVGHWKEVASPDNVDMLINEMTRFLALPLSEQDIEYIMSRQFYLSFWPPYIDLTYRQWLESVITLLREAPPRLLRYIDSYPPGSLN